jgi:hypothetical protein
MIDYGYDDVPPFAQALRRLATLRASERLLRRAIWAWACVTLIWALPIGAWSAESLAPRAALVGGAGLVFVGFALSLRYGALARARILAKGDIVLDAPGSAPLDLTDTFTGAGRAAGGRRFGLRRRR